MVYQDKDREIKISLFFKCFSNNLHTLVVKIKLENVLFSNQILQILFIIFIWSLNRGKKKDDLPSSLCSHEYNFHTPQVILLEAAGLRMAILPEAVRAGGLLSGLGPACHGIPNE